MGEEWRGVRKKGESRGRKEEREEKDPPPRDSVRPHLRRSFLTHLLPRNCGRHGSRACYQHVHLREVLPAFDNPSSSRLTQTQLPGAIRLPSSSGTCEGPALEVCHTAVLVFSGTSDDRPVSDGFDDSLDGTALVVRALPSPCRAVKPSELSRPVTGSGSSSSVEPSQERGIQRANTSSPWALCVRFVSVGRQ